MTHPTSSSQHGARPAGARLAVIIVAYDSNAVILPCLDSISRHNPMGTALEVVVVDNKPDTGLEAAMAERHYTFCPRYVANARNNGFGGGNNVGVAHTDAPQILFLNPDTIVTEDVFSTTVRMLEDDDRLVLGYSLTDPEGRRNDTYSYFPEYVYIFPLLHLLERLSFLGSVNRLRPVNRIAWPWGAAFALSRRRFEAAGGFDENIFLCNEEPDLMRRLPERRLRILPLRIIHLEGHGRQVPASRYLAFLQSTDYYLRKHRIASRGLYWRWVGMKLRLKKCLRRPIDPTYEEAFSRFRREVLNHKPTTPQA